MNDSELRLFAQIRTFSNYSIIAGLVLSIALSLVFSQGIPWQVALAVLALVVGIPHGAVDHLVTVPKFRPLKTALFLAAYVLVAGLSMWFIFMNNLLGFQIIVLVSAVHFGIGDASFLSEIERRKGKSGFPKIPYALAAGFTPVMLPLVNSQSTAALEQVNPGLVGWAGDLGPTIFWSIIFVNIMVGGLLMFRKRWSEFFDLASLFAISLIAPPLVAFAFYFGLWHALRHTARLTLELPSAVVAHRESKPWKAFGLAFGAGIPALVIVMAFTVGVALFGEFSFDSSFLWVILVVVWGLTVPHMLLTARLDANAMGFLRQAK